LGYSLFNALVLHSYKEHSNFPKYIDVPKMMEEKHNERDLKCDPSIEIIEFSEKIFPFLDSKAIEEKLNDRELEKQFFRGLIEVVLYSFLFLTIIVISYEHTYINLKIYSNSHFRNLIESKTNWKNVNIILFVSLKS